MKEKEYEIKFKLNGNSEIYYVTVTVANITSKELKETIVSRTKRDFQVSRDDDFKVISIREYKNN